MFLYWRNFLSYQISSLLNWRNFLNFCSREPWPLGPLPMCATVNVMFTFGKKCLQNVKNLQNVNILQQNVENVYILHGPCKMLTFCKTNCKMYTFCMTYLYITSIDIKNMEFSQETDSFTSDKNKKQNLPQSNSKRIFLMIKVHKNDIFRPNFSVLFSQFLI